LEPRRLEQHDVSPDGVRQRRIVLFQEMTDALGDTLSMEELDIHFSHMPDRYWARTSSQAVRMHLELIHEFIAQLGAADADGTPPVVRWKHTRDRGITEVQVCTWDRLGLLAKVAGAFAAVGLNIIRADIFTRADNIVLDVFEVCEPGGQHVRDEAQLVEMTKVLTAALQPAAVMPTIASGPTADIGTTEVYFDNERHDHYNALMIEAPDRVGLLYDIFTALSACDVNVAHAIITTDQDRVGDVFYLTDADGREITYPARLEDIRHRVKASLQ
jgi:[protein-PII] uridylyltransferase